VNLPGSSRESKIMLLVLLVTVVFIALVSGDASRRSIRHSRKSVLRTAKFGSGAVASFHTVLHQNGAREGRCFTFLSL